MPELPTEYKAAVFESKGAPLTFKQVKLEKPKDGEVRLRKNPCPVSSIEFVLPFSPLTDALHRSW